MIIRHKVRDYGLWRHVLHFGASVRSRDIGNDQPFVQYQARGADLHMTNFAVNTGRIGDGDTFWGLEAAALWGPFSLQGEYGSLGVDLPGGEFIRSNPPAAGRLTTSPNPFVDVPEPNFNGWYVEGSWFFGGRQTYAKEGKWGRPKIANLIGWSPILKMRPRPPPMGTVHRLSLRASQLAVMTGLVLIPPEWLARQITEAFPWTSAPAYLVRDNDRAYGHVFTSRVRAMGIRDRPISPGSPWQNGCAERLIGTLRRECLDQILIFGEAHLRLVLSAYAAYYNQARTHLALGKDAPLHRAVQRSGAIATIPHPGWTAPPIRPDMIFGKDSGERSSTTSCGMLGERYAVFAASPSPDRLEALFGHPTCTDECPLSGVKRT